LLTRQHPLDKYLANGANPVSKTWMLNLSVVFNIEKTDANVAFTPSEAELKTGKQDLTEKLQIINRVLRG
jgi:hypothetical protein